jgi:hypothetical protein
LQDEEIVICGQIERIGEIMVNWTSWPVTGHCPVVWPGVGWMPPGCIEFNAVKAPLKIEVENVGPPLTVESRSRPAATSDGGSRASVPAVWRMSGEPEVRATFESLKTGKSSP